MANATATNLGELVTWARAEMQCYDDDAVTYNDLETLLARLADPTDDGVTADLQTAREVYSVITRGTI